MRFKKKWVTSAVLASIIFSNLSTVEIYAKDFETVDNTNTSTLETNSSTSISTSKITSTTSSTASSTTEETTSSKKTSTPTSERQEKESSKETTISSEEVSNPPLLPSQVDTKRVVPHEFHKSKAVDIQGFIDQYAEQVISVATPNDMYPSVMLAQGILESAAGTSELAKLANNFFGIKFIEGVDNGVYDYIEYVSNEYINGELVPVKSKFRKYKEPIDSFKDNAKKIRNGTVDKPDRYKGVLRSNTKTYKDATAALVAGGYATDPSYATKLNNLIETWHLQKYDQGTRYSLDGVGKNYRVFGDSFAVVGWVLSPYRIKDISILYKDKVIGSGNIGILREDVAKAYPLYNQQNSGFHFTGSPKSLLIGKNNLSLRISLSSGEIIKQTVQVTRPPEALQLELEEGQVIKEGWIKVKGNYYYINEDFTLATGPTVIDGNKYIFSDLGKLGQGWTIYENNWYYADKNGHYMTGWKKIDNFWFYLNADGKMATNWKKIGNDWYHLGASGFMKVGWSKINGSWFYFNSDGKMATGWKKIAGQWYHFGVNGYMKTNWAKIADAWYYFNQSGHMLIGWQYIQNHWYYFAQNGNMKIGWTKIGGYWFYLNADGRMATGWKKVGNAWYYLDGNGFMKTGWLKISNKWYYLDINGQMVTGKKVINKVTYWFSKTGSLI